MTTTPVLRLQGHVFCAVSLALVAAVLAGAVPGTEPDAERALVVIGALVLLLGVPHGALDVVVARQLFGVLGRSGWAVFSLAYVGLSALVVGLWWVAPTLFLCAFLGLSALHFGADPAAGVSRLSRCLYGGAVIVLPALWHGGELERLLGLVAGPSSAAFVVPVLRLLAVPWLCACVLACVYEARTSRLAALEMATLAAVSVTAPPLVAFTVYFCVMHSPRHILRTLARLQGSEARNALAMALWPMVAVGAAAALVGLLASGVPMETRVLQIVFVGLAALTLPHMALLERARQVSLSSKHRRSWLRQP